MDAEPATECLYGDSALKKRLEVTEKELSELRENKSVKKTLKSDKWGLLAAAVNEKYSRFRQRGHKVGWDGLNVEKDSDRGKMNRIYFDQREELIELRSMHLVQRTLKDDRDNATLKARKLFPLPAPIKRARNVIISDHRDPQSVQENVKRSVREKSQALVGAVFSVPSKQKRVLDRLTSQQMKSIGNAEFKRTKQISSARVLSSPRVSSEGDKKRSKSLKLKRQKVASAFRTSYSSDDQLSDVTLDPPSEPEFGSTSTLINAPPSPQAVTCAPPVLQATATLLIHSEEVKVSPQIIRRVETDSAFVRSSTSSSSGCYTSRSSSYESSQTTQVSFEEEEEETDCVDSIEVQPQDQLTTELLSVDFPSVRIEDEDNKEIESEILSDSQSSLIQSMMKANSEDVPTQSSLTVEDTSRRRSWAWLEEPSFQEHFSLTDSEELTSLPFFQTMSSPEISDTPLCRFNHQHPLHGHHDLEGATSGKKLLDHYLEDDPLFAAYCEGLDREPQEADYVTYKLLLLSEKIEETHGEKLEAAMSEVAMLVFKDHFAYTDFAKISHKLALQARYVQEQAFLVTCLGRRLLEKMPNLEEIISMYTTQAVEEMTLLGLNWTGDTPFHNPEMRWDYEDWSQHDRREALAENFVSTTSNEDTPSMVARERSQSDVTQQPKLQVPLNPLRHSSSVDVLVATGNDQSLLTPPISTYRRHSLSDIRRPNMPPCDRWLVQRPDTPTGHMTPTESDVMTAKTANEVSHHLDSFRSRPDSSKPIVISLGSQVSQDSACSSIVSARSIRTIRGSSVSSTLSNPPFNDIRESGLRDDIFNGSPTAAFFEEVEEEDQEEEVRVKEKRLDSVDGKGEERERHNEGEKVKEEETESNNGKGEEGEGYNTRRRLSELITSPVVTVGFSIAVVAAVIGTQ